MPRRWGPERRAHTTPPPPPRQRVCAPKSPEKSAAQQGQTPPAGVTQRAPPRPPEGACTTDTYRHGGIPLSPASVRGLGVVSSLGSCETRQPGWDPVEPVR